jgi:N-methylhydantoinase A/oxoprolinase/acetone carboxylase beta subunit
VIEIDERVRVVTEQAGDYSNHGVLRQERGLTGEPVDIYAEPDPVAVERALQAAFDAGMRCAAVVLAHAYAFPAHELVWSWI